MENRPLHQQFNLESYWTRAGQQDLLTCSIFLGGTRMSKIIDITNKLAFEDNPRLKIKDTELEIDATAENMLKVMGLVSDRPTAKDVEELCKIIFTEDSKEKLSKMKLSFSDYQKVVMEAVELASGNDDADKNSGE